MSDTTSDQRTVVSTTTQRPRERLTKRLIEAGLETRRCTPAEDGEKVSYNHDARGLPTDRTGNYTVFGGDGLVLLDIDVGRDARPEWLAELPPTFEVGSPHGAGRHRYYAVADDTGIRNAKATGDDGWGSVRYGQYAMGPGSTLDHNGFCDDGKEGCPGTGVGDYTIERDRPIATLSGDDHARLRAFCEGNESAEGSDATSSVELPEADKVPEWSSLDATTRRRLEKAEDFPKWGEQFMALKEGRYKDAGFPGDRSRAEFRLLEILDWLLNEDKTKVQRAMTAICRLNPQTDVRDQEIRKWLERDENYRNNELAKNFHHESTYNPPTAQSPESRPPVSVITKSKVFKAVFELRLASTQEIVDHKIVDRETTQVKEALKEYCDDDRIQWVRHGRETLYYIDAAFVPADERDKYDL